MKHNINPGLEKKFLTFKRIEQELSKTSRQFKVTWSGWVAIKRRKKVIGNLIGKKIQDEIIATVNSHLSTEDRACYIFIQILNVFDCDKCTKGTFL